MSTLSITAQQDSVKIPKVQVKNIYIGLKQYELYMKYYSECLQYSDSLLNIIYDQDKNIQEQLISLKKSNYDNQVINDKITTVTKEIQFIESKKIPWYKHPITYGIIGFVGGIYLMK